MKLAEVISSAISVTTNNLPIFRGSYAVTILSLNNGSSLIHYADQYLTPEIISAYGPDLLPFATRKAIAEAHSQQVHQKPLHRNFTAEISHGFPYHNGASSLDSHHLGVSGALPSPQILQLLNIDPDTSVPDIPHQGFFDHLLAQQIATRLQKPNTNTDIPLPAYLRWVQNGCPGKSQKVKPFLDFNQ